MLAVAAAVFDVVGCSGDSPPTESDLPPEADLSYPGSVEIGRSFDEGETGTYIGGGSADRPPLLTVTDRLDGVERAELFDWHENELTERGWTLQSRDANSTGASTSDADLDHQLAVVAGLADVGQYTVRVTTSSADSDPPPTHRRRIANSLTPIAGRQRAAFWRLPSIHNATWSRRSSLT